MIFETLILIVASFVGTNIDDLFINMLFFSGVETKADKISIFLGKYVGTGILMLFSFLIAFGMQSLPQNFAGYLGFVPICLGIREIAGAFKSKRDANPSNNPSSSANGIASNSASSSAKKSAHQLITAAVITIANGADNVGVYIPLFAGFAMWQIILTAVIFSILVAVWCCLGESLANLHFFRKLLTKYKAVIVPVVYISLGAYILMDFFS